MSSLDDCPRVLSISPVAFNMETGSGALMCSIFDGWAKDRLASIYSRLSPETRVCEHNFKLDVPEVFNTRFHLEQRRLMPMTLLERGKSKLYALKHKLTKESHAYREFVDQAYSYTRAFKPDCIYHYLIGDQMRYYTNLALDISRRLNVPLAIHVMDDWPGREIFELQQNGMSHRIESYNLKWRRLFLRAHSLIGITDRMREVYEKRYGLVFTPIANGIDTRSWCPVKEDYSYSSDRPFTIVFAGSVAEKEMGALKLVADSIAKLNRSGKRIELHIHTGRTYVSNFNKNFRAYSDVVLKDFAREDYKTVLANADCLLIALDFSEKNIEYLKLSIQNKTPEYMASGCPILVVGPEGMYTVDYAVTAQWGKVINAPVQDAVTEGISELLGNEQLRRCLGSAARKIARNNHDIRIMKERLLGCMK